MNCQVRVVIIGRLRETAGCWVHRDHHPTVYSICSMKVFDCTDRTNCTNCARPFGSLWTCKSYGHYSLYGTLLVSWSIRMMHLIAFKNYMIFTWHFHFALLCSCSGVGSWSRSRAGLHTCTSCDAFRFENNKFSQMVIAYATANF